MVARKTNRKVCEGRWRRIAGSRKSAGPARAFAGRMVYSPMRLRTQPGRCAAGVKSRRELHHAAPGGGGAGGKSSVLSYNVLGAPPSWSCCGTGSLAKALFSRPWCCRLRRSSGKGGLPALQTRSPRRRRPAASSEWPYPRPAFREWRVVPSSIPSRPSGRRSTPHLLELVQDGRAGPVGGDRRLVTAHVQHGLHDRFSIGGGKAADGLSPAEASAMPAR